MIGAEIARAAEARIGVPFRLHGRDEKTGLDCIGLLEAVLRDIGRPVSLPCNYRLRNLSLPPLGDLAERCGLHPVVEGVCPGDVLFLRPAAAQLHLAIAATNGGFVHAHAGLGRVVLTPPPLAWPTLYQWRAC